MSLLHNWMLDEIEKWADGYWMLPETGIAIPGDKRIDGLLIPTSPSARCMKMIRKPGSPPMGSNEYISFWDRIRIIGIEIKRNRCDFLRGLREKQYQAYDRGYIAGLYVATLKDVCKTREIPDGIGHLIIHHIPNNKRIARPRVVCRRHPKLDPGKEIPAKIAWRLLFKLYQAMNQKLRDQQEEQKVKFDLIGERISWMVHKQIKRIEEIVDQEIKQREGSPELADMDQRILFGGSR